MVDAPPEAWRPVGGGHTRASAWLARAGAVEVFVKVADDPTALAALRNEIRVLDAVQAPFLPRTHGWRDEDGVAVLVLESLADARWPPPFPADVAPLFEALDELGRIAAPEGVGGVEPFAELLPFWPRIADAPEPFLGLGVCSATWLEAALPALLAAEERVVLEGGDLVHCDVWHGNVCFDGRRAVLVDWAFAGPGNHWFDVACAVANVRVVTGRTPDVEIPGLEALATALTGHHAVEAPAPPPEWARDGTTLREDQRAALRVELAWVAELLGLAPPA